MSFNPITKIMITTIAAAALAGCASNNMQQVDMKIHAAQYLNPNTSGIAEPILITVYELKSPMAFKQASYKNLESNAEQVLQNQLIDKVMFEVRPGDQRVHNLSFPKDVKYLGLVASYRNIDQSMWRSVITVPQKPSKKLHFIPVNSTLPIMLNLQTNEMHAIVK